MRSSSFSAWIDAFRWCAAFSVLITHTGIRMLAPVSDLTALSLPHAAYAFLAGFDHQAVMVFFVLSGLLVGGPVLRELLETEHFAASQYLQRRLVRLCVVLWPAFALSAACMTLAVAGGAVERGIVTETPPLSLAVLLCNAAFLQTAACPQWAGNGALWTLCNEFWYYLLFPPLALMILGRNGSRSRAAWGIAALTALLCLTGVQFTGAPIAPYMLVWLAGAVVAVLPCPLTRRPQSAAALVALGLLAIRLLVRRSFATGHPLCAAALDLLVAVLFANLLLSMRHAPGLRPPPWPALHTALAGFSFSLYCTHIPVLTAYIAWLSAQTGYGWQMQGDEWPVWLAVAGGLLLSLGAAWTFALATEAQTTRVRRWLAGWPRMRAVRS